VSTTNYIKLAIIMADDFYNQNIGPLKGSYFGPGVGGSESQRRFSDYYAKSINPVRESIKETEERKMQAERARQIIEAENERRRKATADAAAEKAAQEKVDNAFGALEVIQQIKDPEERREAFDKYESSLTISDRQDSKIKAALAMTQQGIDEYEEEIKEQQDAKDSSMAARAKLLTSKGRFKQARDVAKKISDPTKKKEALTTIVDKKTSATAELKSDFTDITKRADSALSELSKIEPNSISQEPEDEGPKTITEDTEKKDTEREDTSDEKPLYGGEEDSRDSTSRTNRLILQAARDSYAEMFGSKKADELFDQYDADKISASERRELVNKFSKKLKGIKSRSRSNKKFFRQKPKNSNTTEPVGNDKSKDARGSGGFKPGQGFIPKN